MRVTQPRLSSRSPHVPAYDDILIICTNTKADTHVKSNSFNPLANRISQSRIVLYCSSSGELTNIPGYDPAKRSSQYGHHVAELEMGQALCKPVVIPKHAAKHATSDVGAEMSKRA